MGKTWNYCDGGWRYSINCVHVSALSFPCSETLPLVNITIQVYINFTVPGGTAHYITMVSRTEITSLCDVGNGSARQ